MSAQIWTMNAINAGIKVINSSIATGARRSMLNTWSIRPSFELLSIPSKVLQAVLTRAGPWILTPFRFDYIEASK